MQKRVLFAVSSLGLGHATRTISIIKSFSKDYNVYIISHGNALSFLKDELSEYDITFYNYRDYPAFGRGFGLLFAVNLFMDCFYSMYIMAIEHRFIKKFVKREKIDLIISDGRYGMSNKNIPSFLLTHQVEYKLSFKVFYFKFGSNLLNRIYFTGFDALLIPDYKNKNSNLASGLSHSVWLKGLKHRYIGILSSYKKLTVKQDIDYLFVISGFLHDQKETFLNQLFEQSKELEGKKVFILGDPTSNYHKFDKENNIETYSVASKELRSDLFSRAKYIISRCGYSTVMDLIEMDKQALLIPTLNQSEQEYLAEYYKQKNYFIIFQDQFNFNIKKLIQKQDKVKPFIAPHKTETSIKIIHEEVNRLMEEKKGE